MTLLVVLAGLAIGGYGPSYTDWRDRRRARRDAPAARVIYLPSSACRPPQ